MKIENFSNVVFYNHGHCGDIHFTREFIKSISKLISIPCKISHNKPKAILGDIPLDVIPIEKLDPNVYSGDIFWGFKEKPTNPFFTIEDTLYINTWIGQQNFLWMSPIGICLSVYHQMFGQTMSLFDVHLLDEIDYIPSIDYSRFDIGNIRVRQEKNIIVSNGDVFSGQAKNFDINSVIINLAKKHKDCDFYVTEKIETDLENVVDANQMTAIVSHEKSSETSLPPRGGFNLNELSFLSTKCDIVVGRGSGPYIFFQTKDNLFNRHKSIISFTDNKNTGNCVLLENYNIDDKAKQIWNECLPNNTTTNYEEIAFESIDSEIISKYGNN